MGAMGGGLTHKTSEYSIHKGSNC